MFSPLVLLILQTIIVITSAYKPLADDFLQNITTLGSDFDPNNGRLLSPILVPRAIGTEGHGKVQQHFVSFFSNELPKWDLEWYNSTATTSEGIEVTISNLVFQRQPPWTKEGQPNWLTLAAHYDSKITPEGSLGATDGAVPCAIMMHVARNIDKFVTQMHEEMAALGEGGTVEMDMGIQMVFLDGKEALDGTEPALFGSRSLSEAWEKKINSAGSKYPNGLNQINMLLLLDDLGSPNQTIPSYLPITHWAYKDMANLESRMRALNLLETQPTSVFLPNSSGTTKLPTKPGDYLSFMERGVPFLDLSPQTSDQKRDGNGDTEMELDEKTVRDWARIVNGFTLEWLDMMEVWPE